MDEQKPINDERTSPENRYPRNLRVAVVTAVLVVLVGFILVDSLWRSRQRPAAAPAAPAVQEQAQRERAREKKFEQETRDQTELAKRQLTEERLALLLEKKRLQEEAAMKDKGLAGGALAQGRKEKVLTRMPGPAEAQEVFGRRGGGIGERETSELVIKSFRAPDKEGRKVAETLPRPKPGQYVVPEGTMIDGVLQTRINSDVDGPILALVTTPVYDLQEQVLLIPRGSKVIGSYKKANLFGQEWLGVSFHRLIYPDGRYIRLDAGTPGLQASGEAGQHDIVNHHYVRIFGASIAVGLIGGFAAFYGRDLEGPVTSGDLIRENVAGRFSGAAERILDRFLNIMPTITIREGHRIKVWITKDLEIRPDLVAGSEVRELGATESRIRVR